MDVASYTSDSVFQQDSTDDEVDQFSTDSDLTDVGACYHRRKKKTSICDVTTPINEGPSCVSPKISIKSSSKSSVTVIETGDQPEIRKSSTSSSVEQPGSQETLF